MIPSLVNLPRQLFSVLSWVLPNRAHTLRCRECRCLYWREGLQHPKNLLVDSRRLECRNDHYRQKKLGLLDQPSLVNGAIKSLTIAFDGHRRKRRGPGRESTSQHTTGEYKWGNSLDGLHDGILDRQSDVRARVPVENKKYQTNIIDKSISMSDDEDYNYIKKSLRAGRGL